MVAERGLQTVNAGIGMRAGIEIRGYADVAQARWKPAPRCC